MQVISKASGQRLNLPDRLALVLLKSGKATEVEGQEATAEAKPVQKKKVTKQEKSIKDEDLF